MLLGRPGPIALAQGTAFTYQGQLSQGGRPANGTYNLAFSLFPTNVGGVVTAGPITNSAVPVTNGLFTVMIDFGPGVFTGGTNWLDIAVSTNGAITFTELTPRQPLSPVPYAVFANTAGNLSGSIPAGQVSGILPAATLPATVITNNEAGVNLSGAFTGTFSGSGNSAGCTNLSPAALASVLASVSNSFTPSVISSNFNVASLSGAGYAAANGQYADFDWNDIINGNCVNSTNGDLYIISGALTTNLLELDDFSTAVTVYYANNFSTNPAQITWLATATNYLPVPAGQPLLSTNLALGLGPVAVAQVTTQIQSALIGGGSALASALATLSYPPGFNGAGLTNVAPNGMQIWGTWSGPQFVIYVAPYALNSEAAVTNALHTLVRMPQFASITNAGIGFTMIMDVNATFRRNAAGVLQWNYSLYPDGPNFLTALCAASGINAVCAEYGDTTVHLPAGDSGAVCPVSGGGPAGVIFYTGTNGPAYGSNYSDCALPEQIPGDLAVIQSWGFGGVMVNDLASGGTVQQQCQLQSEFGTACAALRNANNVPFGYIAFDTPTGANPGRALGNFTRALHTAMAYDQAETDAETFLRGYMKDFAGCPAAWQVNNIFDSPPPQMTVNALISGWVTPGWFPGEIFNLTNEPCLTLATNVLWQQIETDPLAALPVLTQDFGVNGAVFFKQMAGGRFALGIFNGSTRTTNITVTLPAIAESGLTYTVSNVWSQTGMGTFTSTLTVSNLTARGTGNSAALLLCWPDWNGGNGATISAIATNATAPAPPAWGGLLWNSNNALYWVTSSHTNYVTGP